jgi:hypothetical protein
MQPVDIHGLQEIHIYADREAVFSLALHGVTMMVPTATATSREFCPNRVMTGAMLVLPGTVTSKGLDCPRLPLSAPA